MQILSILEKLLQRPNRVPVHSTDQPNQPRTLKRPTLHALTTHTHPTLANRNTTPVREHPSRNVHSRQLLEQQLSSIRNDNLRNLGLVLARPALELALAQTGDRRHETANLADVHAESVRNVEETLLEEGGGTV